MPQISEIRTQLNKIKREAPQNLGKSGASTKQAISTYLDSGCSAFRFIFSEKENFLFAFLQLIFVMIGYFVWVQMIDWIPQEVWDKVREDDNSWLLNIVFTVWSFVCVGLVTFPLGILSGCMGASYILRSQKRESTVAECLKLVLSKSWTIWVFSWIDGWWTVVRILERLPKKNDRTPWSVKIAREVAYQAWKAASLGFMPALLFGRDLKEAAGDSVKMLRYKFLRVSLLRLGYSAICWTVGILTYIGTFVWLFSTVRVNGIFSFYFYAGFPLIVALALILIVFRPIYLVSSCQIYLSYAAEKEIKANLPQTMSPAISAFVAFGIMLLSFVIIYVFREEIGLIDILRAG